MSAQRFDVVTLFPELVEGFVQSGLLGKAVERGLVRIAATDPRRFVEGNYRSVDDTPFGGGAGMVIQAEPIARAIEAIEADGPRSTRILLTPSAPRFDQRAAERLAAHPHLTFLCGRYEGIDDRIRETMVDEVFSLGDFVLNGGEVAALAMIEAISRLREGVLGNPESVRTESFAADAPGLLLEHPHYTRPAEWRGHAVPEVLTSGDHARVERWRRHAALERTWTLRPELRGDRGRSFRFERLVLALLLDKEADRGALPAASEISRDSPEAFAEFAVVGGRGKAGAGYRVARNARELRKQLRSLNGAPPTEIQVDWSAPARPAALGARALCDVLESENALENEAPTLLIWLRTPSGPLGPETEATLKIEIAASSSDDQRDVSRGAPHGPTHEKDRVDPRKMLAKVGSMIDISQPASPGLGSVARAIETALRPHWSPSQRN